MTLVAVIGLFLAAWLWREHTFEQERKVLYREIGLLLNRIKPETAQYVEITDDAPAPQPAPWNDSEAWHDQHEAAEAA